MPEVTVCGWRKLKLKAGITKQTSQQLTDTFKHAELEY